VVEVYHVKFKF